MTKIIYLIIYVVACGFALCATAECILPVPDGQKNASNRNLAGMIMSAKDRNIIIFDVDKKINIKLKLKKGLKIYTAFGGGDGIEILKPGQYSRIWYRDCKDSKNPKIVYFEIFSTDPNDKPHESYFYDPGQ